jgi:hypothetical protein
MKDAHIRYILLVLDFTVMDRGAFELRLIHRLSVIIAPSLTVYTPFPPILHQYKLSLTQFHHPFRTSNFSVLENVTGVHIYWCMYMRLSSSNRVSLHDKIRSLASRPSPPRDRMSGTYCGESVNGSMGRLLERALCGLTSTQFSLSLSTLV